MSGWQLCGTFVKKVIGDSLAWSLQFAVPFDYKIFSRSDVLVTGGLGFIGSSLARRLVTLEANVTLVDSLIPEYGGNLFNVHDIRDCVTVNLADVRDPQTMTSLIKRRNFLFNLARQTFLGVWIRHLIEGQPIQIFGSGTQRRDFNFIDDVVEAFLLAAAEAASEGEVFNLGHNEHISLQELAALLVRLNNGGQYEIVPFPANREAIDIGDYYGDFSKIQTALGWSPKVSLRTGLAHTLE